MPSSFGVFDNNFGRRPVAGPWHLVGEIIASMLDDMRTPIRNVEVEIDIRKRETVIGLTSGSGPTRQVYCVGIDYDLVNSDIRLSQEEEDKRESFLAARLYACFKEGLYTAYGDCPDPTWDIRQWVEGWEVEVGMRPAPKQPTRQRMRRNIQARRSGNG